MSVSLFHTHILSLTSLSIRLLLLSLSLSNSVNLSTRPEEVPFHLCAKASSFKCSPIEIGKANNTMDSPTPSWVQPRPGQRQEANDCFLFEIPFLDPFPLPPLSLPLSLSLSLSQSLSNAFSLVAQEPN